MARFSPKVRKACSAAGGMAINAAGLFGMGLSSGGSARLTPYNKEFINSAILVKSMLIGLAFPK
jgi:hypothetical protein